MNKCWNCNSDSFYKNDITEYCTSCNVRCWFNNYGGNKEYHEALDRRNKRHAEEAEQKFIKELEEEWGVPYIR